MPGLILNSKTYALILVRKSFSLIKKNKVAQKKEKT